MSDSATRRTAARGGATPARGAAEDAGSPPEAVDEDVARAPAGEAAGAGGEASPRPVSDDPEVVALWRRFKADGDRDARERLILQYAPLVKYVAGRVSVGLPSTVEHGDLTSYGMFGLIDAIERFDLDKGVKFETYAISRIRGAIIDELRSLDWIPRSVRNKARRVEQAMSDLEHELGRTPGEGELAGRLDVDIDELRRTLAQVSLTSVMALDEPFAGEDDEEGGSTLLDKVPDRASPDPEARLQDSEMRKVLSDSVAHLSERERTVVMLYYFEGMTLSQIGEVLSVTESRVCQIHTKAVLGLRTKITERIRG
jgi:RNA polymerase sigma factor for flagellar operon FliA